MIGALKKVCGFLEKTWRRLPWWLRGIVSLRRWYLGIKGVPAFWALVCSLVLSGGVVAFLEQLPFATRLLWGSAGVLGILGIAGHLGSHIKAKAGAVALMSPTMFREWILGLCRDINQYLSYKTKAKQDELLRLAGEEMHFKDRTWADHESRVHQFFAHTQGEVVLAFDEALRRGYLSETERQTLRRITKIQEVRRWLGKVAGRVTLDTGVVRPPRPDGRLH